MYLLNAHTIFLSIYIRQYFIKVFGKNKMISKYINIIPLIVLYCIFLFIFNNIYIIGNDDIKWIKPGSASMSNFDISDDNKYLCALSFEKLRVIDITNRELIEDSELEWNTLYDLDILPDNKHLALLGRMFQIREIETGSIIKTYDISGSGIKISPKGDIFAVIDIHRSDMVKIYDLESGELLKSLDAYSGDNRHDYVALSLTYSPKGDLLALTSSLNVVSIWNTETWELIRTIDTDGKYS